MWFLAGYIHSESVAKDSACIINKFPFFVALPLLIIMSMAGPGGTARVPFVGPRLAKTLLSFGRFRLSGSGSPAQLSDGELVIFKALTRRISSLTRSSPELPLERVPA